MDVDLQINFDSVNQGIGLGKKFYTRYYFQILLTLTRLYSRSLISEKVICAPIKYKIFLEMAITFLWNKLYLCIITSIKTFFGICVTRVDILASPFIVPLNNSIKLYLLFMAFIVLLYGRYNALSVGPFLTIP